MISDVRRAFVDVGSRAVHFRRAGEGPPVVMLHGSPGDGQMLEAEIAACATKFTVFALDTPGFGYSDALAGETLTVRDLAAATAEAMRALELPPCPVYGTHTGAAIGIELGVGWPEQVSFLLLEGLPAFTEAEIADLFAGYFEPMQPDPLGGHLVSTWMRFRDQFTWFPWLSRDVRRLNPVNRPAPEDIDLWVSMFYRSCKTYQPAYRAACHYGQRAILAAEALTLPAIYMASVEDMLFSHLDRLPPMKPGQRIERLPHDHRAKMQSIAAFLGRGQTTGVAPPHPQMPAGVSSRMMVDGPNGQIFVRLYGSPHRPAVILMHDSPGSGVDMDHIASEISTSAFVIVPDHPGCGQTCAPAENADILSAAAANAIAVADALGIEHFVVGAEGCGAAVAALLPRFAPGRVSKIFVENVLADDAAVGKIAPPIPVSPTGGHWVQAWLMLRDGQIYLPWYDGSIAAQRQSQGNFDAKWLHDRTVSFMSGRTTYHLLPRAAAAFPALQCLAQLPIPVCIVAEAGLTAALMNERTNR